MKRAYGFTIVELLIVIVVIAILAAISIVAYSNISQKASNTAITNAASSSLRIIQAYITEHGTYPYIVPSGEALACITAASGCQLTAGVAIGPRTVLETEMARTGSLPQSIPTSSVESNGIIYRYSGAATVEGQPQPAGLIYWLQGADQDCKLPGILSQANPYTMSTTTNSHSNQTGKTRCNILTPGPAHQ